MKKYTIWVQVGFAPFEPYEFEPLLTLERAQLTVKRLEALGRRCNSNRKYEIREI